MLAARCGMYRGVQPCREGDGQCRGRNGFLGLLRPVAAGRSLSGTSGRVTPPFSAGWTPVWQKPLQCLDSAPCNCAVVPPQWSWADAVTLQCEEGSVICITPSLH